MPRGRVKIPAVVRFWKQVEKTDHCWNWVGAKDKDGYGQITDDYGRNKRSHRFSYRLHKGPFKDELRVCHTCDNPACVRPKHLFLGTDDDNLKDAINKGRLKVKGVDNPSAKLTEDDVRAIRKMREETGASYAALARKFNIGEWTTAAIIKGIRWGHVK